jgi:hypothetical protein
MFGKYWGRGTSRAEIDLAYAKMRRNATFLGAHFRAFVAFSV